MVVLSTDTIIIDKKRLVLIQRDESCTAFPECWALPGGVFEDTDETLALSAIREVKEETGLDVAVSYFDYFDYKDRDPRGRTVTVAFIGKVVGGELSPGDDAIDVHWFNINQVVNNLELAFDHSRIVNHVILAGYFDIDKEWADKWSGRYYRFMHHPNGNIERKWWWEYDE
jgi:8-oxo-dGTP diphosphatase